MSSQWPSSGHGMLCMLQSALLYVSLVLSGPAIRLRDCDQSFDTPGHSQIITHLHKQQSSCSVKCLQVSRKESACQPS